MIQSVVYSSRDYYAGWPANHGAWQWGDEFLVGFLRGRYARKSMHNIAEPFEKLLARSKDGGYTWEVEFPGVDFECIAPAPTAPAFVLGKSIMRVCGVYDHGGDVCYEPGGFYLSEDRGYVWHGPYPFTGLEEMFSGEFLCTARTRVHGGMIFLSRGNKMMWGTDETFCAVHDGKRFAFKSWVCNDNARAVMPAVAQIDGRLVCALRRRKTAKREGWVDAFSSDDAGASWQKLGQVGVTGSHNGNPPALIATPDDRLVCCYGDRDHGNILCTVSEDAGKHWGSPMIVRQADTKDRDIGYPQLFLRSDGVPVCVYYWASKERPQQHIAATSLEGLI